MQLLSVIFSIGLYLSFNCICPTYAERSNSVKVTLPPFQIELRSRETSETEELTSSDLKSTTEIHLSNVIVNKIDELWNGFESITLNAEEESMNKFRKLAIRSKNSRKVQSTVFYQAKYSGTVMFSSDSFPLPTTDQMEKMVLDAFVGQGKIDYLRLLRSSKDEFLSSANYAKVWIPEENEGNNNTFLIIAVISSVIIVLSIILMVYYIFFYKRSGQNQRSLSPSQGNKSNRKSRGQTRSSNQDIRLVPTRSLSPPPAQPVVETAQPSKPKYSKRQNRHPESYHQVSTDTSMMSKDTIDINGSFDMIAWKNTCLDSKTPFETDITMITNASPNKTVRVEVPREIGGRKKAYSTSSSSRLSHGTLNQHNRRYEPQSNSRRSRK